MTSRPPDGTVDWQSSVTVRCSACGTKHDIGPHDLLPRDTKHVCNRCDHVTAVPSEAAEVICLSCHLYAHGPASRADYAVAATFKATQHKHAQELRDTLVRAKYQRYASSNPTLVDEIL